jgi:hypothetical protein
MHIQGLFLKSNTTVSQANNQRINWRVDAINPNGKHFGLGQMRNTKYRNLDGYRMIDWSLRYIAHRYSGSSCKAFAHWQKHGWH